MRLPLAKQMGISGFVATVFLSGALIWAQPTPAVDADASVLEQAQTALEAGQYPEAEALWKQVVDAQPKSADAYYNLGLSLHHQMELEAAISAYETAIRLNPKYDASYINLGLALIEMDQLDAASKVFHQVLALPDRQDSPASTHTLAHYNLAIILQRQGKNDAALEATQDTLAISPDFTPAQELLNQLQSR